MTPTRVSDCFMHTLNSSLPLPTRRTGVCIHWTGLLDCTSGMDYILADFSTHLRTFLLSMIKITVLLLAKQNVGSGVSSGYI